MLNHKLLIWICQHPLTSWSCQWTLTPSALGVIEVINVCDEDLKEQLCLKNRKIQCSSWIGFVLEFRISTPVHLAGTGEISINHIQKPSNKQRLNLHSWLAWCGRCKRILLCPTQRVLVLRNSTIWNYSCHCGMDFFLFFYLSTDIMSIAII